MWPPYLPPFRTPPAHYIHRYSALARQFRNSPQSVDTADLLHHEIKTIRRRLLTSISLPTPRSAEYNLSKRQSNRTKGSGGQKVRSVRQCKVPGNRGAIDEAGPGDVPPTPLFCPSHARAPGRTCLERRQIRVWGNSCSSVTTPLALGWHALAASRYSAQKIRLLKTSPPK